MSKPWNIVDTQLTHRRTVACDGGNGALGHPRVFLEIPPGKDRIICPYCSAAFILRDDASAHGNHH